MEKEKAFTLLEILLVVAAIVILAGIVIIAINPSRQLATVRNSQREMDVNTIYKAANQYIIDKGLLSASITSTPVEICRTGASDCTGLVDLSVLSNNSTYLVSLPTDPKVASPNGTGYTICQTASGRVEIYSLLAELDQQITTGNSCSDPAQIRNGQRTADIQAIESAMATMYSANGYYFVDPAVNNYYFVYKGLSLVGGQTRATNCSTVTSESGHTNGAYGSSIPCPTESDWCIKLGANIGNQDESSGANCDTGTVYLRNIPLNNHLPVGTWTAGVRPYEIFTFSNFNGTGGDYLRIKYRKEGGGRQSDHFLNGVLASCGSGGDPSTNGISCQ